MHESFVSSNVWGIKVPVKDGGGECLRKISDMTASDGNTSSARVFKLNYCLAINGRSGSGVRQVTNWRKVRPATRCNAIASLYICASLIARPIPANVIGSFETDAALNPTEIIIRRSVIISILLRNEHVSQQFFSIHQGNIKYEIWLMNYCTQCFRKLSFLIRSLILLAICSVQASILTRTERTYSSSILTSFGNML